MSDTPDTPKFKKGQIVEIYKIDARDSPEWLGLQCQVADKFAYENPVLIYDGDHTRLVPLSDRPDAEENNIDPRQTFFWPTSDLRLVHEVGDTDE